MLGTQLQLLGLRQGLGHRARPILQVDQVAVLVQGDMLSSDVQRVHSQLLTLA